MGCEEFEIEVISAEECSSDHEMKTDRVSTNDYQWYAGD